MTGSENQSKTIKLNALQLPLKGFIVPLEKGLGRDGMMIEGMGGKRIRVHTRKRQPRKK